MVSVRGLVWDDWNKEHISKHEITCEEVEEVCCGKYKTGESFRKRIVLDGKTKTGKLVTIILSSEDKNLKQYENGIYYVITAFESEVKDV